MQMSRLAGSATVAALASVLAAATAVEASAQSVAHRHIGHVAERWNDTPDNMGLLAAAQAEAEVAAQHAGLAAQSESLDAVKRHVTHVVHALTAEAERGPGKGYGLGKAATGVARHIGMAGEADDASDAVKAHANHVKTSAENVAAWVEEVLAKAEEVAGTDDLEAALTLAGEIADMTQAIMNGTDADGDGRISWGEGEGGLAQAATHLRLMREAEGIG